MPASGITTSVALLMDGFLVVDLSYARAMCAGMTLAEGGDIAGLWPFFLSWLQSGWLCLRGIDDGWALGLGGWAGNCFRGETEKERERERERALVELMFALVTYMMRVGSWRPLTLLRYRVFNMSLST